MTQQISQKSQLYGTKYTAGSKALKHVGVRLSSSATWLLARWKQLGCNTSGKYDKSSSAAWLFIKVEAVTYNT